MPAIYFSLGLVQPFADMSSRDVEGEPGVTLVIADGKTVGMRLEDPRMVIRLDEICARAGVDAALAWEKLRGDTDVLLGRRQATWGGGGR
ncbi:MAG: hypothetical protein MUE51_11130 [Thermoleophilia bacterium]|nr:hypothetical protein [Thermoleophilia bacterium]